MRYRCEQQPASGPLGWWDAPQPEYANPPQVPLVDQQWTGLLDADGRRIMRLPTPIGFVHNRTR